MADEYIRKEDAVHIIMGQPPDAHYPSWYASQIEAIPAADVVPAVHSRWKYKCGEIRCPECGNRIHRIDLSGCLNFCPNCGAKMDERGE